MIDQYELYKQAIEFFPRRSDIRKRRTSNGAKILRAIFAEAAYFNEAVEKLRASFFAINYKGHANDILLNLSAFTIGSPTQVSIVGFKEAETEEQFTKDSSLFFIEDGICYLHEQKSDTIEYIANNEIYTAKLELYRMWNIIDEFAMMASIERYDGETNEELLNRVFDAYKYVPNSTEQGLKNAIKNAVTNELFVNTDDIVIEPIGKENIYEVFDEESLIESLGILNKDVLRHKVWGKSKWEHQFANVERVSPKWDEALESIQDGVGNMKVLYAKDISNEIVKKVVVDTYNASEKEITAYMMANSVDVDVTLKLTKLANRLAAKKINYRIAAEKAIDVSNAIVHLYNEYTGNTQAPLYQLLKSPIDYEEHYISNHKLLAGKPYTIHISSPEPYNAMRIRDISLYTKAGTESLMTSHPDFLKDQNGWLMPSNVVAHIDTAEALYNASGFETSPDGIVLKDTGIEGYGEIPLVNAENKYVNIKASCPRADFMNNNALIKKVGFKTSYDSIFSNAEEAMMDITMTCSEMSFDIVTGAASIEVFVDNKKDELLSREYMNETFALNFNEPHSINVHIKSIGKQVSTFKNFTYANYEVTMEAQNASLIKTNSGYLVRDVLSDAKLLLKVSSATGFTPVVSYVHIGGITTGKVYETTFTPEEDCFLFMDVDGDVQVTSSGLDMNINKELTIENKTNSTLNLKLKDGIYSDMTIDGYKITKLFTASAEDFYVSLTPYKAIGTTTVNATYKKEQYKKSLKEIFGASPIYVSSYVDGFMIDGRVQKLEVDKLKVQHNKIEMETSLPVRFTFHTNGITQEGLSAKREVVHMGCFANKQQQHIGYYSEQMLGVVKDKIDIVDTIFPALDPFEVYYYTIQSPSGGANITFTDTQDIYSINPKQVKIHLKDFAIDENNYVKESVTIKKSILLSSMMHLERTFAKDGVSMDLSEYMIEPPEELELVYADTNEERTESFYVENDGFNKLINSNIGIIKSIKVNNELLQPNAYTLLKDEGVICWNDESLYGQEVDIVYTYKVPYALKVNDLSYLYKQVGYNVETMAHDSTFTFVIDGDELELSDEVYLNISNATSYTIGISNEKYTATIVGKKIVLQLAYDDDEIIVKSGYYYRGGNEYYHFSQPFESSVKGTYGVIIENGKQYGGELILSQASENFLPNTSMALNKIETVSYIDFEDEYRVNDIDMIGACDAINYWMLEEMNMQFLDAGWKQHAIFTKTHPQGRAMLWLNPFITKRYKISIIADAEPKIGIGFLTKEKDVLVKSYALVEQVKMERVGKTSQYTFDAEALIKEGRPLYIVLTEDTKIEDVVISDSYDRSIHKSNGELFSIDFSPKRTASQIITVPFSTRDIRYSDVELRDNSLVTGMDIYWGYTPIKQFGENWKDVSVSGIDIYKDQWLVNETNNGTVLTKAVPVPKHKYVSELAIYMSDLTANNSNISVNVETCATRTGSYQSIYAGKKSKSDVLVIDASRLLNYVRVRVEVLGACIISNLDIYAKYHSKNGGLKSTPIEYGTAQTKYYDIGDNSLVRATAYAKGTDYEIRVRGIRQNDRDLVPTKWYEINEGHLFEDYRYIQYQVSLLSENANVVIERFQMEVL